MSWLATPATMEDTTPSGTCSRSITTSMEDPSRQPPLKKRAFVNDDAPDVPVGVAAVLENRSSSDNSSSVLLPPALLQALRQIPLAQKAACLQALQEAPRIFTTESDPAKFLAVEDGNAVAAAERLCLYWIKRKEIFAERARLAVLDLSGNGALTLEDIAHLQSGALVQLPDDVKGRPVLYANAQRLPTQHKTPVQSRFRVLFFNLTAAASHDQAAVQGVTILRHVTELTWDSSKNNIVNNMVQQAMPLKIKAFRLLAIPSSKARRMFETTAMPAIQQLQAAVWGKRSKVHIGSNKTDLMNQLRSKGFSKSGVPFECGGTWTFQGTSTASAALVSKETVATSAAAALILTSKASAKTLTSPLDRLAEAASRQARDKERLNRKRKNDIVYARKKREREKVEVQALQRQCVELQKKNVSAKKEQSRLETMLEEANTQIALQEQVVQQPTASVTDATGTGVFARLLQLPQQHHDCMTQVDALVGMAQQMPVPQPLQQPSTVSLAGLLGGLFQPQQQPTQANDVMSMLNALTNTLPLQAPPVQQFAAAPQQQQDPTVALLRSLETHQLQALLAALPQQQQQPVYHAAPPVQLPVLQHQRPVTSWNAPAVAEQNQGQVVSALVAILRQTRS